MYKSGFCHSILLNLTDSFTYSMSQQLLGSEHKARHRERAVSQTTVHLRHNHVLLTVADSLAGKSTSSYSLSLSYAPGIMLDVS